MRPLTRCERTCRCCCMSQVWIEAQHARLVGQSAGVCTTLPSFGEFFPPSSAVEDSSPTPVTPRTFMSRQSDGLCAVTSLFSVKFLFFSCCSVVWIRLMVSHGRFRLALYCVSSALHGACLVMFGNFAYVTANAGPDSGLSGTASELHTINGLPQHVFVRAKLEIEVSAPDSMSSCMA